MKSTKKTASSVSKWMAWAQLVRLPNVFTIIADIAAAFLFTAAGPSPISRLVVVILAGVSLYWSGMILNDVFDEAVDRKQRSKRPIPLGWISKREASVGGWVLLALGICLATASGRIPSPEVPTTWLPGIIAVMLAIMIVGYDGPLKSTVLAPAAMGSCRFLSFLLGASPCLAMPSLDQANFLVGVIPNQTLAIATGFGVYIMGVTTMARREAKGGSRQHLLIGSMTAVLGATCLAIAPRVAAHSITPKLDINSVFPILIGMITVPVFLRAIRAVQDPTPQRIQVTIKIGILTVIPLSAAFAALGAGPVCGTAIFALVIPSLILSARFRVT